MSRAVVIGAVLIAAPLVGGCGAVEKAPARPERPALCWTLGLQPQDPRVLEEDPTCAYWGGYAAVEKRIWLNQHPDAYYTPDGRLTS